MNRISLWMLGIVVALFTSCGKPPEKTVSGEKPAPTAAPAGAKLFAVSFQTMNNPFFVELNEGIRRVVESHGDRLVTLDAQFSSLKQKGDVADVLQQKPAAVFLNPVNWEGVKGTLI